MERILPEGLLKLSKVTAALSRQTCNTFWALSLAEWSVSLLSTGFLLNLADVLEFGEETSSWCRRLAFRNRKVLSRSSFFVDWTKFYDSRAESDQSSAHWIIAAHCRDDQG